MNAMMLVMTNAWNVYRNEMVHFVVHAQTLFNFKYVDRKCSTIFNACKSFFWVFTVQFVCYCSLYYFSSLTLAIIISSSSACKALKKHPLRTRRCCWSFTTNQILSTQTNQSSNVHLHSPYEQLKQIYEKEQDLHMQANKVCNLCRLLCYSPSLNYKINLIDRKENKQQKQCMKYNVR